MEDSPHIRSEVGGETSQTAGPPRSAALLTAGLGAAHAVLFLVAFYLLSQVPGAGDSDAEVITYYTSSAKRLTTLVGVYIMPFAGIAFLWFVVSLRMWTAAYGRQENAMLSNVQLVSGIVYIGLFFAAAGANSVVAASVEFEDGEIDPGLARLFPHYGSALMLIFALKMAAAFVLTTSRMALGSAVLPKWFAYTGLIVGVAMLLAATFSKLLALMFPVWLLMLTSLLLFHAWRGHPNAQLAAPTGI